MDQNCQDKHRHIRINLFTIRFLILFSIEVCLRLYVVDKKDIFLKQTRKHKENIEKKNKTSKKKPLYRINVNQQLRVYCFPSKTFMMFDTQNAPSSTVVGHTQLTTPFSVLFGYLCYTICVYITKMFSSTKPLHLFT